MSCSHVSLVTRTPDLTFLFDAHVSDVACSALLDTGAADNFICSKFASAHHLHVHEDMNSYELANGERVSTSGTVTTKLSIQGYTRILKFSCMDLGDGIDVILSDAWGKQEQAILDFGTH